jgi:hypothetical protein
MALTLIKEDGSIVTDANSYADVAECDAYHEGHLYASAWTAASSTNKAAALVMATRVIDQSYKFNGFKRDVAQKLQWPRVRCPDPDQDVYIRQGAFFDPAQGNYFDETKIPQILKDATCEMARECLIANPTTDPDSTGLKSVKVFQGVEVEFDKSTTKSTVSKLVETILSKLGSLLGRQRGGGQAKLTRS